VIDVTERKRARRNYAEVKQSSGRCLDLAATCRGFRPNRERLYINRIAVDYLGLSLDEWRQRGSSGYAAGVPALFGSHPEVHPDDSKRLKHIRIVLFQAALHSSWRCGCEKLMEVIVGFWLATTRCATIRGRSSVVCCRDGHRRSKAG